MSRGVAAAAPRFVMTVDDAVRRLGAVERRGGGSLDSLDPFDLVGVDVVDARRGIAESMPNAREGAVSARALFTRTPSMYDGGSDDERHTARRARMRVPARADVATGGLHRRAGYRVQELLNVGGGATWTMSEALT